MCIRDSIKTDNTVQEATIDVTEIIGTLENAGTGEDGKPKMCIRDSRFTESFMS